MKRIRRGTGVRFIMLAAFFIVLSAVTTPNSVFAAYELYGSNLGGDLYEIDVNNGSINSTGYLDNC